MLTGGIPRRLTQENDKKEENLMHSATTWNAFWSLVKCFAGAASFSLPWFVKNIKRDNSNSDFDQYSF